MIHYETEDYSLLGYLLVILLGDSEVLVTKWPDRLRTFKMSRDSNPLRVSELLGTRISFTNGGSGLSSIQSGLHCNSYIYENSILYRAK